VPDVPALSTAEAVGEAIAKTDLIVAGAPVLGFKLPTQKIRDGIRDDKKAPPADLSQPMLRTWLDTIPAGHGRGAALRQECCEGRQRAADHLRDASALTA
jgi:hypothetical protein